MLKLLQKRLPEIWTDELYSDQFLKYKATHKHFDHALKHVLKAASRLIELTEEADHHGEMEKLDGASIKKYLADLVICTVRLALTSPTGPINLEAAVLERVERKMRVKLK